MRLDAVLSLESITATSPVIHAGHDNLGVSVTWVHLSEMEHVASVLHGGEMLLTQGRGIPKTEVGQRTWVQSLSQAGVAGIGVETGHVFDELPAALIEEAKILKLPLIELPRPAYFMEITRAVHGMIIRNEYDSLSHSAELTRRLGRVVLAGGSIHALLDEVTSALGAPVALTGPTHFLRTQAPLQHPALLEISDWRQHTLIGHDLTKSSPGKAHELSPRACSYFPIHIGGELWGCLHSLTVGPEERVAVDQSLEIAGTFLAMAYGPRENLNSMTTDMPSEILRDVLSTYSADKEQRLRWGGLDPEGSFRVLVFEPIEIGADGARIVQGHRRPEALLTLAQRVQTTIAGPAIVGHINNRIAAIVPEEFTPHVFSRPARSTGQSFIVGVGELSEAKGLPRGAKSAFEALDYAVGTGRTNGVFYAEQLSLERLLLRLNEDGTLKTTVEDELGPLLNLNYGMRKALLETLETYFAVGMNKREAALRLGVDRRTIQYRLERVDELVGKNFNHPDKQLALRLAVRGYRFLAAR
jgi:purine catabolism regulator